ncbi:uncharacterized protein VNE69_04082 [Vairimorpha necatrix]|uniref:Uncharacterized protein n=1 Tax=Vairimorpha necatrix TaxID=6039 RepID=A0AAX4JBA2_9MICR
MFLCISVLICSNNIEQNINYNLMQTNSTSLQTNIQKRTISKSNDDCNLPLKKRKLYLINEESTITTVEKISYKANSYDFLLTNPENRNFNKCNISKESFIIKKCKDYKILLKNLKYQIQKWDEYDNKTEVNFKIVYGKFTNEYYAYEYAQSILYQMIYDLNLHLKQNFDKIWEFLDNSKSKHKNIILIEKLNFIEEITKYLKRVLPKNLNYKSRSYKILDFYSVLPARLKILKTGFEVVKEIKISKNKFIQQYFKSGDEITNFKNSITLIHNKLIHFFNNIEKVKEFCNTITENLEKIVLMNY